MADFDLLSGLAKDSTVSTIAGALKAEDTAATSGDLGLPILVQRHDSDNSTVSGDGDYAVLKSDEEGRLKVATKPASIDPIVGDLSALNSVVYCDVRRCSNVVYHVKNVGTVTMAAGTFVFEASLDSTTGTNGTWFSVQAARSNANIAGTSIAITSLAANAGDAYAWESSVNGYKWFRVRCSVATTANSKARWTLQPGTYATEPLPVNQVSSVTATANIGTNSPTIYADSTTTLAAAGVFTGTARDAGSTPAYQRFVARAFSDQSGTLAIEDSTDNTTWRLVQSSAVTAGTCVTLAIVILARYNRVKYTNGSTIQGAFRLTSGYLRI